tara:strand:+ start:1275 stop:1973 length:699 start_codon:yes stop_codon:yes gene_type:complete
MKLYFKPIVVLVFFIFTNFSTLFAEDFKETYVVEIGKIDIGRLLWDVKMSNDSYKVLIKLKSKGFLSKLYKFEGSYEAAGSVMKGSLMPLMYKQLWLTKKKRREVEIIFDNHSVIGLEIFPYEKEQARVEYNEIENHFDPLSSFLNILTGKEKSKTIDGRRIYSMMVEKQNNYATGEIKKILIEDYVNIWADHKKNNLEYIEIKQEYNEGAFSMPEVIKIKFKGLIYKLRKT